MPEHLRHRIRTTADDTTTTHGPYVALDAVHLARWRGHALARLHDRTTVDVLPSALVRLDPTFTRAETALRVDLTTALTAVGERDETRTRQADLAGTLALEIGSERHRRRLRGITSESRWGLVKAGHRHRY